jgi:SAM-dependent methyltransferase
VKTDAGDYEYRGMLAQSWDLLRGDTSGWPDRPFYREVIERQPGPALDVGCGTGRLLLDYLAAGLDVDGVDNSPEMLAICRGKAEAAGIDVSGRLHEQRMESLDLPRRYATIFVPSSSFQILTEPGDARAALRRFHDHLLPAGVLVMPFMRLWPGREPPPDNLPGAWACIQERERPEDGAIVRRWQRARYDMMARLEHTEDRYEVMVDGAIVATELHERSPAARWYTQADAIALYRDAGFADVRLARGFTEEPATAEDERLFTAFGVRAERTSGS